MTLDTILESRTLLFLIMSLYAFALIMDGTRKPLDAHTMIMGYNLKGEKSHGMGFTVCISVLTIFIALAAMWNSIESICSVYIVLVLYTLIANFHERKTLTNSQFKFRLTTAHLLVMVSFFIDEPTNIPVSTMQAYSYSYLIPVFYMASAFLPDIIRMEFKHIVPYYTGVVVLETILGTIVLLMIKDNLHITDLVWILVIVTVWRLIFLYRGWNVVHAATLPYITKLPTIKPNGFFWFGWLLILLSNVFTVARLGS